MLQRCYRVTHHPREGGDGPTSHLQLLFAYVLDSYSADCYVVQSRGSDVSVSFRGSLRYEHS